MIAIYVRVSTEKQKDNYSIPTQIDLGIKFAESQKEKFKIYQEAGSGTSIIKRIELQRMLADISKGKIHKVWVVKSDRLSRKLGDAEKLRDSFNEQGVKLYINGEILDFSKPENLLQYHITSAVSEYERSQIVARSIRGKQAWQNEGKMVVPNLYGYDFKFNSQGKREWFVKEDEAEVIRKIFHYYNHENRSINRIMHQLNENGFRTKTGKYWQTNQIKKILTQSIYIGKSWDVYGKEIDSAIYAPIVDEKTFYTARNKIKHSTGPKYEQMWKKAKFELSSLMSCKHCGASYFYGKRKLKSGGYREYYQHNARNASFRSCDQPRKIIYRQNIESIISDFIFYELVNDHDNMAKWLNAYRENIIIGRETAESEINELEGNISTLSEKKGNIIDLVSDGTIPKLDAKMKIGEINIEIKALRVKLKEYYSILQMHSEIANVDLYKAIIDLALKYEKLKPVKRRKLYMKVFKDIIIDNDKIYIQFHNGLERKLMFPNIKSETYFPET